MKKLGLLILILLITPFFISPIIPLNPPEFVGETSDGLGPSIGITYEISEKCMWDDWWIVDKDPGDCIIYYDDNMAYMMEDDGDYWTITLSRLNVGSWTSYVYIQIDSPYTDLKQLNYAIAYVESGDTWETDDLTLYVYTETSSTSQGFPDSDNSDDTGSISLDSSYVVDGKVSMLLYMACVDTGAKVDLAYIKIDQLQLEYNDVTETRRSTYDVIGGTVKYTVDFTTWDYNVNATLAVPNDWTYQDVNPDCGVTSDEFKCLVPEDYEATYTMDALLTGNWEPYFETSFESGETFHPLSGSYDVDSQTEEYTIVMDGSASLEIVNSSTAAAIWFDQIGELPDGDYVVCFSVYLVSGSAANTFRWWDGAWNSETLTFTSGEWVNFEIDIWVSGVTSGRNWQFYIAAGELDWIIDGFAIYQSSVTTGQTITGTCNHIHPNGYATASFFTFEYNCSTWLTTNTSQVADYDGTWSIDPSSWSLASGTETFYTWDPNDLGTNATADSITYPFTTGSSTTMHLTLHMTDGALIPFGEFKIYVDDNRLAEPQYTTTSISVNLTITDLWNYTIYSDTSLTVADFVDVVLTGCYYMTMHNQQDYAINVTITWNSIERVFYLPPQTGVTIRVYGGSYTLEWVRCDNGEEVQTDTITVSDDVEVYTEKVRYPPGDNGGGVVFIRDVISSIAFWLLVAIIGTVVVIKRVYPWAKKEWDKV